MAVYNTTQNLKITSRVTISALAVVALAFSGMAAAEQLYVNEGGWWWEGGAFNASGTPIQTAVGAAVAGDSIYVWNGSYSENVDVDKPRLTLEGEGADVVTVTAADSGDHVFEVGVDWVNISGFAVRRATDHDMAGIYLDNADYCNIYDNNASNNYYGIWLWSSSNNTLQNNTANSNNYTGVDLWFSSSNTLQNNTANSNTDHGIYLRSSSNNTIENNTMSGNKYNFGVSGGYTQNIDTSNVVDGKPIYYWVDQQDKQIPSDAGFVGVVNSKNITVRDLILTKNFDGVLFVYTENSRIWNITASNNYRGIYLEDSSDNTLSNNTANLNDWYGIVLHYSSSNTLTNNTANSNNWCGIWLLDSSSNTLTNNTITGNAYNFGVFGNSLSYYIQNIDTSNMVDGKPIYYWVDHQDRQIPSDAGFVGVVDSTNITVRDLTLTNNIQEVLFAYTNNSRIENVTASNNYRGICLRSSSNNTLENNNCSNNEDSIRLSSSNGNTLTNNTASLNSDGGIRLSSSSNNNITNNTANSNNICGIYLRDSSNNIITNNTANSNNICGIYLRDSSNNIITCNLVQNNTRNGFSLCSGSINNISYNNIIENGNYNSTSSGWEWQFYIDKYSSGEAKHNYWGAGMNNSTIDASIHDEEEGGGGEVDFYPFETEPISCTPGPERPAFTTADAVIALQIAVGSRPPDPRWDVSRDGSVTSLDALMILQAAAGSNT